MPASSLPPPASSLRVRAGRDPHSRLRIASAAMSKYSWSLAATGGGGSVQAIASRMWRSHASRSAGPIANGAWRIRRRGWPRSSIVGRRAAPVLGEEQRQPVAGARQVVGLGVDGEERGVRGDALVEPVDEGLEEGHPAGEIEERGSRSRRESTFPAVARLHSSRPGEAGKAGREHRSERARMPVSEERSAQRPQRRPGATALDADPQQRRGPPGGAALPAVEPDPARADPEQEVHRQRPGDEAGAVRDRLATERIRAEGDRDQSRRTRRRRRSRRS